MKHRLIYILPIASLLIMNGCRKTQNHLYGSWILDNDKTESKDIHGFTLGKSGYASAINTPRQQYEQWNLDDNMLIISGKYLSDSNFTNVTDTFFIKYVDDNRLIVNRNNIKYHYKKEQ